MVKDMQGEMKDMKGELKDMQGEMKDMQGRWKLRGKIFIYIFFLQLAQNLGKSH
ncbi:hypothetical protein BDR06DRAFT_947198 [Suillus hirtellus]|nr:hypothetical protein BDR06DRAFT_947198 [Suillus hirtellus]